MTKINFRCVCLSLFVIVTFIFHFVDNGCAQDGEGWESSAAANLDYWTKTFSLPVGELKKEKNGEVFSEEGEIYKFKETGKIRGLTVSGAMELYSEKSLVRVILVDDNLREYLVYEAYPRIVENKSFAFIKVCEETCVMEAINPSSLRLDLVDASIRIDDVSYVDSSKVVTSNIMSMSKQIKKDQDAEKIKILRAHIERKKEKWIAGETSISILTYEEKKKLIGADQVPNWQGAEYYKGGIFEIKSEKKTINNTVKSQSTGIPEKWDWRNVHGENWLTPVKNQLSSPTCSMHSIIGALEAQINLFYNQHLDVDLSEQMVSDCVGTIAVASYNEPIGELIREPEECIGDNLCDPGFNYCKMIYIGIVDENCFPFANRPDPWTTSYCNYDNVCSNWNQRLWKISDFHVYKIGDPKHTPNCPKQTTNLSEDELKKVLILKGPMHCGLESMNHFMVLVGFEKDPADGQTIWIFKNSWGTNYGNQGYGKIKTTLDDLKPASLPIGPIVPPLDTSYWPYQFTGEINCVDKDNDGYYNWGISEEMPVSCPDNIPIEKDYDDSNYFIGPIDNCPNDPNKTEPGVCGCGIPDTDSDGDGTFDCIDDCPNDPRKTDPGTCGCGVPDVDTDSDGTFDCNDNCPSDPNKTKPGVCGCGIADTDTDLDGTLDCNDDCPNDPNKIQPGICGCGMPDTDTDLDGTPDCTDGCPNDTNKTQPGVCGCGILDTDSDGDGIPDCNDGCDNSIDSDGDGINDCDDLCPKDPNKTKPGTCGCGAADSDSDGDGTLDCMDVNDDGDGLPDGEEQGPGRNNPDYDGNGDGIADYLQGNVASFHTYNDQNYITIVSPSGTSIRNCKAVNKPSNSNSPQNVDFAHGFFGFSIDGIDPGGALTATMYFPAGENFNTYYKYGPTPDNPINHWYEFLHDGQTGANINGNVITLHFLDGMRGDDDLTSNATISDIGAPGVIVDSSDGGGDVTPVVKGARVGGGGCFISTTSNKIF